MGLMEGGPGESGPAHANQLEARSIVLAREALRRYDFSPRTSVEVINLAENVTLRLDDPVTGERAVMRLHRPGYHHSSQIKSELLWLDALLTERTVEVPPPIGARSGERVITIDDGDQIRYVTVCGWVEGRTPELGGELSGSFTTLGAVTARLHEQVAGWRLPPGFCRRAWGTAQLLGDRPTFGPWRAALGLAAEELALLSRAEAELQRRLASFPQGPEAFGLVHADLRLANLLVDKTDRGAVVKVIGFDDCGASWLMYDFAAAVSFMEDDPRVPELLDAWSEGYRTVRSLPPGADVQLETLVMLRRLVLLGWVAGHAQTATEAAALGAEYTLGACAMAERFLAGGLWR